MSLEFHHIDPFASLEFIAKQVVEGFITGLHKSPFHGFSVEFAEHRLYNTGESTKHIDWKLFARTDKLFVKRFEEETNLRCHILIDRSSSMYFPVTERVDVNHPNKIVFSAYAAAALMYLLTRQRDAVGLSIFSDQIENHTEVKSNTAHLQYLYSILDNLLTNYQPQAPQKTNIIDNLHLLAEQIHKRSLIIIFSDMFDDFSKTEELFTALQHLRHQKNEVILFHVNDKDAELDFNYDHRPYRFIDMESGQELKLNPADVRKQYIKSISEFTKELEFRCTQYHIDFVRADIREGFYPILHSYLLKRQQMM